MHSHSIFSSCKNHRALRFRRFQALYLVGFSLALAALLPHIPLTRRASAQWSELAQGPESPKKLRSPASVPGEILVRFRQDAVVTKNPARASVVVREGRREFPVMVERFEGSELISGLRVAHVEAEDTLDAIAALNSREDVLYAEPNYLMYKDTAPNDPRYPEMYGLNNTGQGGGTAGADIDAELAWNITTGSSNVVVGVIDSGIDIAHPDLQPNIWTNPGEIANNGIDDDANGFVDDLNGWDFFNNDKTVFDSASIDDHGTHVAGTIGAVGNNSRGVVGVNWQVKIMPLKFLGSTSGSGPTSAAISAINYVKQMAARGVNIRVINNSWGGGMKSQALLDAITALNEAGILFVAAAGNDGTDNFYVPHYPAGFVLPNIISVAATNSSDSRLSSSNFGGSVTMGAPGANILSTLPGDSYGVFSGTSMAAAHVSGAAALVLATKPGISMQLLAGCLSYSGDIAPSGTRTRSRLNAFRSIQSAIEDDSTPPAPAANLRVEVSPNGRTMDVRWNAPGDDGNAGTASDYDLVFVDLATGIRTPLSGSPVPGSAGTSELVGNLPAPYRSINGTLELRTYDNVGNVSTARTGVAFDLYTNDPYLVTFSAPSPLSTGGERLSLSGDDTFVHVQLPLDFRIFRKSPGYTPTLSSNGVIHFSQALGNANPNEVPSSVGKLNGLGMIAGLWDDLVIDNTGSRPGDGVYEVKPDANTVIYRWQAATYEEPHTPVNFEIELRKDGTIIYRYGDGNSNIFPVVGLGAGELYPYVIESHTVERDSGEARKNLGNAQTVTFTPRPPFPPNTFDLGTDNYIVDEDGGNLMVTVTRGALTSGGGSFLGDYSVSYTLSSGTAIAGADFSGTTGTITFSGDSRKTFLIPIVNDSDDEPNETFTLILSNPTNGSRLGVRTSAIVTILDNDIAPPNPIDDSRTFIRQHYLDFLSREPDQGGWDYWSSELTACGNDAACMHRRRIDVSAAFFVELEFQRTGYVVYRLYRAAHGTTPNTTTRANVSYAQFNSDRAQLDEGAGLPQSTMNLANAFVQRPEFLQAYPVSLSNAQFVNKLFDTAQLVSYTTERQQQIDGMNNGQDARAGFAGCC